MEPHSTVANLGFLIEEEREQFRIAEERSKTHDTEAAAAVAGAIAFGAAIFAAFSESELSTPSAVGFVAVGLCLAGAIAAGILARREPEPFIRVGKFVPRNVTYDAAVRVEDEALRALRELALDVPVEILRHRSLDLSRARVARAQLQVTAKRRTAAFSLAALYLALAILANMALYYSLGW